MNIKRWYHTLRLYLSRSAPQRAEYLRKNKVFGMIGEDVSFSPRVVPLYPELIRLHNNVNVAAGVRFITHDVSDDVINNYLAKKGVKERLTEKIGCIEVMDNVFVGADTIILYNVKIGSNVIIGAGSVVTKDIPSNSIAAGVPAKVIGSYDDFVNKRLQSENTGFKQPVRGVSVPADTVKKYWEMFENDRK